MVPSPLSFLLTLYPVQLRTFANYALERLVTANLEIEGLQTKSSISLTLSSIELSLASWLKEVISLLEMVLEVKVSTEKNSKTKTLSSDTLRRTCYLWLMLEETLMDLSFSLLSFRLLILMESMLCLVVLSKELTSSK